MEDIMTFLRRDDSIQLSTTKISEDYDFAPSKSAIVINDSDFKRVLYIVNTTDNIVIYNIAQVGLGGTAYKCEVVFDFDVSGMTDTDDLLILYEAEKEVSNLESKVADLVTEQKLTNKYLAEMLGDTIE